MALQVSGGSVTKEAFARNMKITGAGSVIGKLVPDKDSHLKATSNLVSDGNFRIDSQAPSSGHANLQVQVNGVHGEKSSVGGALVESRLYKEMGDANASGTAGVTAKARKAELTRCIQSALRRSVGTWKVIAGNNPHGEYQTFSVSGKFSS
ncbi:MAG TPA: hypothetical protein VME43_07175 [Bryobacteraceae bacterium]|nr:hypothetical protein [Bryobacteraceae bacterium]